MWAIARLMPGGKKPVRTDPASNIKPDKAKSTEKIDGAVAMIMALDRCIRNEGVSEKSVYDARGLVVL